MSPTRTSGTRYRARRSPWTGSSRRRPAGNGEVPVKYGLQLLPLTAQGRLELPIGRAFLLPEAAAAHQLAAGGYPGGNVMLLP